MRVHFDMMLRGKGVSISATLDAPEPDVGIMGWLIDEMSISSQEGLEELDWILSEEEMESVYEAMPDPEGFLRDDDYEDEPFDDEESNNEPTKTE